MSIKLNGATNGSVELNVPAAIGSDLSVTIPAIAGEILVANASGNVETSATGSGGSSGSALIVGYQQGTWTPGVVSSVNMGNTLGTVICTWSRIGNHVTVYFNAAPSSASGNTAVADQLIVNDLPYDIDSSETNSIPFLFAQSGGLTNNCQWWSTVYESTGETRLTMRSFNLVGTTTRVTPLRGSLTYLTDDTTWTPINGATVS